jgi:hypothetical protein
VTLFFRYLDLLALCLRFPDGLHATTGRFPIYRYDPNDQQPPSERIEDPIWSAFVPGLPSNFYSSTWCQSGAVGEESIGKTHAVSLKLPDNLVQYVVALLCSDH